MSKDLEQEVGHIAAFRGEDQKFHYQTIGEGGERGEVSEAFESPDDLLDAVVDDETEVKWVQAPGEGNV